jgi:hypothetical protein
MLSVKTRNGAEVAMREEAVSRESKAVLPVLGVVLLWSNSWVLGATAILQYLGHPSLFNGSYVYLDDIADACSNTTGGCVGDKLPNYNRHTTRDEIAHQFVVDFCRSGEPR